MPLTYRLVDVFTRERFGGNPLAVFPDARDIEPSRMQQIAFELNLSETTFVLPSERADCDVRVRIFTPRAEIPMAGHPTVGTAFVLDECERSEHGHWARRERSERERVVFEEGVGPVPVERVRARDGVTLWRMTQPRPRFGPSPKDAGAVAAALGLGPGDLASELPLECVATGMPFLVVPLRALEALARARCRVDLWEPIERELGGAMPYLVVRTGDGAARARMFAPTQGIAEDPATGSAAGPLGAWALAHGQVEPGADGVARLLCTQGVEFGRPSELHVEVEGRGRDVTAVRVAGACAAQGGGWFEP
jgi:trans-2,3-dihydro-3-hydroxyanthranilate isomerase